MRHLLAFLVVFSLAAAPAWAEDSPSVYEVTGVVADVTSDNAGHARDQALMQAQHTAFAELLQRLGVDPVAATKISDSDLSAFVKSFEIQNERASAVHYVGTFTIHFRQSAVRAYLEKHDTSYTDTPSKPELILPVLKTDATPVLWEDKTKWRGAWDSTTLGEGLVPVVLPQGGKEDGDLLTSAAAIQAKANIKPLIDKYQAGGAIVAVFNVSTAKPEGGYKVDLLRYDGDGNPVPGFSFVIPAATDMDVATAQAVKQTRAQLEKDWRTQALQGGAPTAEDSAASAEPSEELLVNVPVANLAEWAQIKHSLEATPAVATINVLTLQRGLAQIELGYRGGIDALQASLKQAGLSLTLNGATGNWVLQAVTPAKN